MFEVGRASPITWLAVLTRNRAIDRKRRAVLPTEPSTPRPSLPTTGRWPAISPSSRKKPTGFTIALASSTNGPEASFATPFLAGRATPIWRLARRFWWAP